MTHVSDHASVALEPCRSPRISAHTLPVATRPLISSWAERAGKNVLNTPMGRSLKPGGALSTNGSMQSYQDIVIVVSAATTDSVAVDHGPPARSKLAETTGSAVSAKAGKSSVSIDFCSHRATPILSLQIFTRPSVSVLCKNKTWPAPDGHHRTRQWLARSDSVLPPSGLSRMKEFSPVIITSFGSTGGIGWSPFGSGWAPVCEHTV